MRRRQVRIQSQRLLDRIADRGRVALPDRLGPSDRLRMPAQGMTQLQVAVGVGGIQSNRFPRHLDGALEQGLLLVVRAEVEAVNPQRAGRERVSFRRFECRAEFRGFEEPAFVIRRPRRFDRLGACDTHRHDRAGDGRANQQPSLEHGGTPIRSVGNRGVSGTLQRSAERVKRRRVRRRDRVSTPGQNLAPCGIAMGATDTAAGSGRRPGRAAARGARVVTAAASGGDVAITLGVEEEFFLVDPETRDLVPDPDPGHLRRLRAEPRATPRCARTSPRPDRNQHPRVRLGGRGAERTARDPPAGRRGGGAPRGSGDGRLHPPLHGLAGAGGHPAGALRAVRDHVPGGRSAHGRWRHATSTPASAIQTCASAC